MRLRRTPLHFAVRSCNIGDGPADAKLADLIRFARMKPAGAVTVFILVQEAADRMDVLLKFCKHTGWRMSVIKGKLVGHESAILYNPRWARKPFLRSILIHIGYLGRKGKGQDRVRFKELSDVRVWMRGARRYVRVLNHHAIVSVEHTHGPEHDRRLAGWQKVVREFFKRAKRTKCVVIGGGDWNTEKQSKLLSSEVPSDWVWDTDGDTIRHMEYDLIGHMRDRRIAADDHGIDETDGSKRIHDHRSPWASYELR